MRLTHQVRGSLLDWKSAAPLQRAHTPAPHSCAPLNAHSPLTPPSHIPHVCNLHFHLTMLSNEARMQYSKDERISAT